MTHQHECQKYIAGLSEYIDGELSTDLCIELEKHLLECERCRIVVNTTRKTIEFYQTEAASTTVPPGVRERLYKRLRLKDFLTQSKERDQIE